jgi:hypothetical protein
MTRGRLPIALSAAAFALAMGSAVAAQDIKGAIDFHVHQAPDSVKRQADADDVARRAKAAGMRGLVMKNHWESTASLAYMVRKAVPGIEVFGGIALNRAVGGINLEAVKRMAAVQGGYGRVVWLPTFDNDTPAKRASGQPFVAVSKDGALLPEVIDVIDFIGKNPRLTLETGHVSPAEGLMVVREAKARGVVHIVITHAISLGWTVAQMQEAARQGAFIEFVYHGTLGASGRVTLKDYADAIKQVGPAHVVMSTDLGDVPPNTNYPLEAPGFQTYVDEMRKLGFSVAELDQMTKTNPALALGLAP